MVDLKVRLEEAELAYHRLITGQTVAEVRDHNGELIRYSASNLTRLWAYIQSLRAQLGIAPQAPARVWIR